MHRILLKNATLIDGTGAAPVPGDLLISGGRIEDVGPIPENVDAQILDCTGLTVAPGFIDAHTHSDLQVVEGRREKIRQGVTSEVVGNCGFSAFPLPADPRPMYEFANGILCGGKNWGWRSAGEYLNAANRHSAVNVYTLAGHGSLRVAYAGMTEGALSAEKVNRMAETLQAALEQGAVGLSTGLMYYPGSSAPPEELEQLCRTVAATGKLHTTHMRDYSAALLPAIDEQIGIARCTGCRLQISHLQAVGAKNWHLQAPALERIEKAASEGVDVAFDCYPYVAGSTVLTQFLPQWALEGGTDAMLARFTDREQRRRIIHGMLELLGQDWTDLYVSAVSSDANQPLIGRNLAEIAGLRGCGPEDTVLDLLAEENGAVNILEFNQSESNLKQLVTHPLSTIISDGFYVSGKPHPRLYGAFPKLLGDFCRRGWLSLPVAIHKITEQPARRYGIKDRGCLKVGYCADITVFDANLIDSPATYSEPQIAPVGIRWVLRNGEVAFDSSLD